MELILGLVLLMGLFGLLDLAALRWGANSRRYTSDWKARSEADFYEPRHLGIQ